MCLYVYIICICIVNISSGNSDHPFDICSVLHGWPSLCQLAWQHIFIFILMEKYLWLLHNQCNRCIHSYIYIIDKLFYLDYLMLAISFSLYKTYCNIDILYELFLICLNSHPKQIRHWLATFLDLPGLELKLRSILMLIPEWHPWLPKVCT